MCMQWAAPTNRLMELELWTEATFCSMRNGLAPKSLPLPLTSQRCSWTVVWPLELARSLIPWVLASDRHVLHLAIDKTLIRIKMISGSAFNIYSILGSQLYWRPSCHNVHQVGVSTSQCDQSNLITQTYSVTACYYWGKALFSFQLVSFI